jgi:aerobic-type carbon monoxide dehydrogenase small subunit (CoxS/CutS family)
VKHFGFQCGYCTPGMIVTASTLCESDLDDLPRKMKGNLCRCTGYRAVEEAIRDGVSRRARTTRRAEPRLDRCPPGRRHRPFGAPAGG